MNQKMFTRIFIPTYLCIFALAVVCGMTTAIHGVTQGLSSVLFSASHVGAMVFNFIMFFSVMLFDQISRTWQKQEKVADSVQQKASRSWLSKVGYYAFFWTTITLIVVTWAACIAPWAKLSSGFIPIELVVIVVFLSTLFLPIGSAVGIGKILEKRGMIVQIVTFVKEKAQDIYLSIWWHLKGKRIQREYEEEQQKEAEQLRKAVETQPAESEEDQAYWEEREEARFARYEEEEESDGKVENLSEHPSLSALDDQEPLSPEMECWFTRCPKCGKYPEFCPCDGKFEE
jgi:ABC-type multidrug transport system fused ATPase/permease subunit